jgi:PEP-CTERM motif
MNNIRERFVVMLTHLKLVPAVLLLSVTCAAASPITIGTFEIQNDVLDPFFAGPTFVVTNDSAFAGMAATFADIHLLFGLDDLSTLDFLLTASLGAGEAIDSNGLTIDPAQSLLPDLGTVLGAYLHMTLLDSVTSAVLSGTLSLAATDPPLCLGCSTWMSDFTNGSTLAIRFDPELPGDGTPVPEPASLFLMGGGIAALAAKKRWLSR